MSKRVAVLYNPSSGKGRSLREKKRIEKILTADVNGIEFDWFVSESEGHLKVLAAGTVGQYPVIVGVGGDTTFNIVAREIINCCHHPAPVMGMIGTGSSNDIVRALGIAKIENACKAIIRGQTGKMDVGYLKAKIKRNGDEYEESLVFLGTLSVGLGTEVNRYVEQFHQRHRTLSRVMPLNITQLAAGLMGISHSFSAKKLPIKMEIQYTDSINGDNIRKEIGFSLLVILNTPFYANGFKLGKNGGLFDSLLDCCVIHTHSFMDTLRVGMKVRRDAYAHITDGKNQVKFFHSPLFKIFSKEPVDIQVDGDIIEVVEEVEVTVIPGKLEVFVR
jgi:diacylglycerol kinase family enzyme